jgi:hypothetical protein
LVDLALRAQFHRARARWLGVALTRDLAASLGLFLASALLAFHLDCRLVLSPQVRVVWGSATLCLVTLLAAGGLWRALRRRPDDRAVALGVERRYPHLRERLLSAVELGRLSEPERGRYSGELLSAVQAEAQEAARGLDFRRGVSWEEARPVLAACGLLATLATLHVALAPAAVAAWWERMLYPGAGIPVFRKTRVWIAPRSALLLRGGDLDVAVTTEGRPVQQAVLHFRAGGGRWARVALQPPFHHRLQDLADQTEYYATAGDGQSDRGIARVTDPPSVVGLRLRYQFPRYMARPDETVTGISGPLTVPLGTRVDLTAAASKPLRSATMEGGSRSLPLAVQGTTLLGSTTLWTDTTFRLRLRDADGFEGRAPQTVEFHALPDAAPEVRLDQPVTDMDVVADAVVPLRVTASEDHGLHRLWLGADISRQGSSSSPPSGSEHPTPNTQHPSRNTWPLANGAATRRSMEAQARWNLEEMALRPGDVVVYRAEADDFDDLRGPNVGRSVEQRLRVIDRAEMERRLAEGWEEWDRELAQLQASQDAARAAVQAARTPAALAEAEQLQRELAPRAEDLSARAQSLAQMARINRMASETTLARQEAAGAALAEIARQAMPAAADRIRESAARPSARAEAEALQAEISRRLAALRRQVQSESDLEALARRAEELARAQEELQGRARRLLPETLGRAPSELSSGQRGELFGMSRAQGSLREATGQFEGALGRAARAALPPAVAAARLMRERAVPERQGQAVEQITGNRLARAAAGQQTIAADLRRIAALLRQPPEVARGASARQEALRRAGRQLDQLMARHAEVMRQTNAQPDAAASRQLSRQERALRQGASRLQQQLRRQGVSSQAMQEAARQMARAEQQLGQGAPRQAQSPQRSAQEAMREMARRLQEAQGQGREDTLAARLGRELGELAQRQGGISQGMERANQAPDQRSTAGRLAPRQEAVSRSAQGLERRMPSETFRSAMGQARAAMHRVLESLRQGQASPSARSASRQAERLLRQMARALEEQRGQPGANSRAQGAPGGQNGNNAPNTRELARRLADLRLLRSMEQGLRDETTEAEGQEAGREQRLRDLAGQQGGTRRMTDRAASGLQRFPGVGRRVGEAAGAMGQAQQGLQQGSGGAETQGAQGTAVMRLTQAIGQGQQQLQAMARAGAQPGSQNGPQQARRGQQPALDSIDVHGTDEGGPRSLLPTGRRGFGLLSPGDQQALRQGAREKVPADYADLIRRYYNALSERAR